MEGLKVEMEIRYQKMESLREKVRILEGEKAILQEKIEVLQEEIKQKHSIVKSLSVEIDEESREKHTIYKKLSALRETRTMYMPKDEVEQTMKNIEKYVEDYTEYLQELVRMGEKYFRRHIEDKFDIRVLTKCICTDTFSFAYQFSEIDSNLRTI